MVKARSASRTSRRWPAHLSARLRGVRQRFGPASVNGLLVVFPTDIRYLTGFSGEDSWLLVTARSATILSDRRFEQELRDRHAYARAVMRRGPLPEALKPLAARAGVERLAVQAEHLTLEQREGLVRAVGARRLKPVRGWLGDARAVKDEEDLKGIRRALQVQQSAFRRLLPQLRPGMTEREVAARLELEMRLGGADGAAFPTIVASGANASIPHHVPGNARVKRNVPLLIDFGARVDGYCGDLTRMVALGRLPNRMARIYRIALEAQQTGIGQIRAGRKLAEVDAAARRVIRKAGYGKQFGHGLGHGLGLEVHESPRLGPRAEGTLQPGHVVTVEPGIYLPDVGGVRIEDDVLVTEEGPRVLSSLPSSLESVMI